jgi:hypothetical protein
MAAAISSTFGGSRRMAAALVTRRTDQRGIQASSLVIEVTVDARHEGRRPRSSPPDVKGAAFGRRRTGDSDFH